ncbi:arginine N-methyltransferase, type I [Trypanosoma theileri]|uniref:Arginine N-methyltransferase, type I n=1 Tax=Trypanosoma theileri TaxID=67003 RepID=A0A1X0P0F1_9TRYP|nr:arginine N-methyltransferase, type I [Trypanosoma theileri]ORC89979.1 arginine N-methyltransferase, type I [Trypanosoma theileri]
MGSQGFIEDYDSAGSIEEQYFGGYADPSVHRVMLEDAPRMSFFRQVMSCDALVRDRVVVDVGSGTGILSIWAARAGAKHVFSIEASSLSQAQSLVIADNGLSEKITVLGDTMENIIECGAEKFVAQHESILKDSGISVIVSEWMGFFLLHEGMLLSVIRARDFFDEVNQLLGISRRMEIVPERATIHVAPMNCDPYYEERYHKFWGSLDGIDFSRYGKLECEARFENTSPLIDTIPSSCLLHEGVKFAEFDLAIVTQDDLWVISSDVHFDLRSSPVFKKQSFPDQAGHTAVIDGFTVWFDVHFRDLVLSTSPHSPPTHWKQATILLPSMVRSEKILSFTSTEDAVLDVALTLSAIDDPSMRCYTATLELK